MPAAAAIISPRRLTGARGFTLIEVMVAMLVLSLGVLGAAGLQIASMRANRDARNQEVAVRLASELGDLMRANTTIARQNSNVTNPYLVTFTGTAPSNGSTCFIASNCADATAVARRDIDDWTARVAAALPGARVAVCFDSTPYASGLPQWACSGSGDVVMVKIGWTQSAIDRNSTVLDQATRPSVMVALTPKVDPT